MPEEQKDDFIGKRVNDAGKIFGMADKNALALMLAISIIFNFIIFNLYSNAKDEVVITNNKLTERIIEEVKRQVPKEVKDRVEERIEPIAKSVDSTKSNVDKFIERISK